MVTDLWIRNEQEWDGGGHLCSIGAALHGAAGEDDMCAMPGSCFSKGPSNAGIAAGYNTGLPAFDTRGLSETEQ